MRPSKFPVTIRPILSLSLVSLLSLGCGGTANSPSLAIERVMQADRQAFVGFQHYSEIVPRMRQIDLTGCPNEFQAAYLAHIHAWEEVEQVLRAYEQLNSDDNHSALFWESVLRGFIGDLVTIPARLLEQTQELDKNYAAAQQQVETTYRRLEEIAVSQGAKLPPKPIPSAAPQP
jgi:hypothetical protein